MRFKRIIAGVLSVATLLSSAPVANFVVDGNFGIFDGLAETILAETTRSTTSTANTKATEKLEVSPDYIDFGYYGGSKTLKVTGGTGNYTFESDSSTVFVTSDGIVRYDGNDYWGGGGTITVSDGTQTVEVGWRYYSLTTAPPTTCSPYSYLEALYVSEMDTENPSSVINCDYRNDAYGGRNNVPFVDLVNQYYSSCRVSDLSIDNEDFKINEDGTIEYTGFKYSLNPYDEETVTAKLSYDRKYSNINTDVVFKKTKGLIYDGFYYMPINNGEEVCITYCPPSEKIEIPSTIDGLPVTKISNNAFQDCTNLKELILPETFTSIDKETFKGCESLTDIDLPKSIREIGQYTFSDTSIKNITMYDNVYTVGNAFGYNTNITIRHNENGGGKIYADLFQGNLGISEVTLSDGITSIEDNAFASCENLRKIIIPKSVTKIRYTAFTYDENVVIYGYEGSFAQKYAENCGMDFVSLDSESTTPTETESQTEATTTTPSIKISYGDVNVDGKIGIADAVLLNKYLVNSATLSETSKLNADCNKDGEINPDDTLTLLKYLVGTITEF